MLGEVRFLLIFASEEGFSVWSPPGFFQGSMQLLNSSHDREREKALLRSVMVGGVWHGFLFGNVRREIVTCRFCGVLIGMDIFFGLWLSSSG